ncbi:MAG: rhomboid family intramembrane serine protease [Planctomycetales bacterium]|jgi:membrane associated rhomboid family serine protease
MKSLLNQLQLIPHRPIVAVIGACLLIFLIQDISNVRLSPSFGAVPLEFRNGLNSVSTDGVTVNLFSAVARLFTPIFLHGGPGHVVGNMVFLWAFGSLVSRHLGNWWALVLCLLCGATGNLTQIYMSPNSMIPIIGASGSVAGLEGVYFGLVLRWALPWPDVFPLAHPILPAQLVLYALVGIGFDIYSVATETAAGVAYGAHLGGFAFGLLFALLLTSVYGSAESWSRKR